MFLSIPDRSVQKRLQQVRSVLEPVDHETILLEYYLRHPHLNMTMNSLCKRTNIINNVRIIKINASRLPSKYLSLGSETNELIEVASVVEPS